MIFLLAILLVSLASGQKYCLNNGFLDPSGEKCYHFIEALQNFDGASSVCGAFGSVPASVQGGFDSSFISASAQEKFKSDYWIGLWDPSGKGVWQFLDGKPVETSFWASGYPVSDGKSFCVAVRLVDGRWYNVPCDQNKPFVCQQPFAGNTGPSSDWLYFPKTDSYFKGFSNATGTIDEFEQICVSHGAHLASMHSLQEHMLAAASVISYTEEHLVIGAYFNGSAIVWRDESPYDYNYFYSYSFRPNKDNPCSFQNTLRDFDMMWYHAKCNETFTKSFICKKPRLAL